MSFRVTCPVCNYRIKAPDGAFGRRGTCPRCKLMIRLPSKQELAEREEARKKPPSPSESAMLEHVGEHSIRALGGDADSQF